MASITEIFTAAQNIVTALNQLGQTFLSVNGTRKSATITNTTGTLIVSGQGRLVSVVVTDASGSTQGSVYDSSNASSLVNKIAAINHTIGRQEFGVPFSNGLVIVLPSTVTAVVVYWSQQ